MSNKSTHKGKKPKKTRWAKRPMVKARAAGPDALVWHYTTGVAFIKILDDGFIKPSTAFIDRDACVPPVIRESPSKPEKVVTAVPVAVSAGLYTGNGRASVTAVTIGRSVRLKGASS